MSRVLVLLIIVFLLAGCGRQEEELDRPVDIYPPAGPAVRDPQLKESARPEGVTDPSQVRINNYNNLIMALQTGVLRKEAQRRNPYPPTPESLAAARQNYLEQCASCHGENGGGNGPQAEALHPPPANLIIAAAPGNNRTDGMLYYIVTHGVEQMPPYKATLTDKERWNLVSYMRTLPENRE